jgi:hypothetical protein
MPNPGFTDDWATGFTDLRDGDWPAAACLPTQNLSGSLPVARLDKDNKFLLKSGFGKGSLLLSV